MKRLSKTGFLLASLTTFSCLYLCIGAPAQKQSASASDDSLVHFKPASWTNYVDAASDDWKVYINTRIAQYGETENTIKSAMVPACEDWGKVDLGNGGAFKLLFKLDDYQQAQFDFPGTNSQGVYTNSGYKIIPKQELWLKDPDGRILFQGTNGI